MYTRARGVYGKEIPEMREKDLEKILVREVKRLGGCAYKWVSPGNAGVPDRIIIFPNRAPIFAELKAEGGKPTQLQESQLKKLSELGQQVSVITGIHGLILFFSNQGHQEISYKLAKKYESEV